MKASLDHLFDFTAADLYVPYRSSVAEHIPIPLYER